MHYKSRSGKPRQGYVLVLVITTLLIAATALVQVAHRSLQKSQRSLNNASALQSKWGRITLSRLILPAATQIFESREDGKLKSNGTRNPLGQLRDQIVLGDQGFVLVLSDEDAKLNLASLARESGSAAAIGVAQDLIATKYRGCLKTIPENSTGQVQWQSWGELVDLVQLRRLHGEDRALAELTNKISLWGSGRLNIQRASDSVIVAQCAQHVTQGLAQRILESLRESATGTEVELLLQRTVKNDSDRLRLADRLSDGSSTYSLWIESATRSGRRTQEFVVRSVDETGLADSHRFLLE